MRNFLMVLVLCSFTSCQFFESKDKKAQKLVDCKLEDIDWNDVDQYPLFNDCDELVSKPEQKKCFEETLALHFSMTFQESDLVLKKEVKDTIFVDFILENNGIISVMNIQYDNMLNGQMEELSEKIAKSLKSLPKIEPAIKQGVPVSTKFRIPIVLNLN